MIILQIKERIISDDIKEDYEEDNGSYFYALGSDRYKKTMVKVKTKAYTYER